jgi:hypothetical protein
MVVMVVLLPLLFAVIAAIVVVRVEASMLKMVFSVAFALAAVVAPTSLSR